MTHEDLTAHACHACAAESPGQRQIRLSSSGARLQEELSLSWIQSTRLVSTRRMSAVVFGGRRRLAIAVSNPGDSEE